MWQVYVLRSEVHDRFYIGMCSDFEQRLKEHNAGKTKSTKGYRPWRLFFKKEIADRRKAREREKYLKSGVGREFINEKWTRSLIG